MLTVNKKNMTRFSCCQHRFTTLQEANNEDVHDYADADDDADDDDNFAFKLFRWGNCSFSPSSSFYPSLLRHLAIFPRY